MNNMLTHGGILIMWQACVHRWKEVQTSTHT